MASYTQINNDEIRETVSTKKTCAWCGGNNHSDRLFRYGTLSPMLDQSWQDKLFCSVGCMRIYHS